MGVNGVMRLKIGGDIYLSFDVKKKRYTRVSRTQIMERVAGIEPACSDPSIAQGKLASKSCQNREKRYFPTNFHDYVDKIVKKSMLIVYGKETGCF